ALRQAIVSPVAALGQAMEQIVQEWSRRSALDETYIRLASPFYLFEKRSRAHEPQPWHICCTSAWKR
ncbi:MAG TPA: hypothetical protein VFY80_05675, partial [Burkholderiales bacterium]|nr:hypothetical protein [Burkholderiales bacterium]